jgi:hypothetical protein
MTQVNRTTMITLTDYHDYSSWLTQLKSKCKSLEIWPIIDPSGTETLKPKPTIPLPPNIGDYPPQSGFTSPDDDDGPYIPSRPSELSPAGLKSYKEDNEFYKGQLEAYKIADKEYERERTNIEKVVTYIHTTVSPHLQRNCCQPSDTVRQWIQSLIETVGVDKNDERDRARARYLQALRPMRQPGNWEIWLTEYDHAATDAETENVSEVQLIHDIINDFIVAIMKVAPTWGVSFQEHGRRDATMTRKEMMKRFREHMSFLHPSKGKQQRSAFAAGGPSPAGTGESNPGTDRDAYTTNDAPSASNYPRGPSNYPRGSSNNPRGRGRPREKRPVGSDATTRQSSVEDTAAAGGLNCPACEMRHNLKDCYYAFPEYAPDWFNPRPGFTAMVKHKIENDSSLQEQMRKLKKPRTTPKKTQSSANKQADE